MSKKGLVKIYMLIDPRDSKIRYIGKTKQSLKKRLINHIVNSKHKKTHKDCWIMNLLNNNFKPQIELIDDVQESEWIFWEQHYISLYKSWGFNLTNLTIGGDGVNGIRAWNKGTKGLVKSNITSFKPKHKIGLETRIKKGERFSSNTEFKKGMKPWNFGVNHTIETIQKMKSIKLGKISSNRKLTFNDALKIRELRKDKMKIIELATKYKVSLSTIKGIIFNKTYILK